MVTSLVSLMMLSPACIGVRHQHQDQKQNGLSTAITATLLRSAKASWPSQGILLTYHVDSKWLVVQVSKLRKGPRSFASVAGSDLIARCTFNSNGDFVYDDVRRRLIDGEVPSANLIKVIQSFVKVRKYLATCKSGTSLNVVANKRGYRMLLFFPSNKPGDWISLRFDHAFKLIRADSGY